MTSPKETSYQPIALIFAYLVVVNVAIAMACRSVSAPSVWMQNFMASFLIAFSFFKLLDLKGFAKSYANYDLITKQVLSYGYLYPFIELALGLGYVLWPHSLVLNFLTAVLMLVGLLGILKAKGQKKNFECACVGTLLKVPLGSIAVIENTLMLSLSVLMLWVMVF